MTQLIGIIEDGEADLAKMDAPLVDNSEPIIVKPPKSNIPPRPTNRTTPATWVQVHPGIKIAKPNVPN